MIRLGRRALLGGGLGLVGCERATTAELASTGLPRAPAASVASEAALGGERRRGSAGERGQLHVTTREPILHARFAALRILPFVGIARAPTPLVEAEGLARAPGVGAPWRKREDLAR
jgi:hypothetical protein